MTDNMFVEKDENNYDKIMPKTENRSKAQRIF